MLLEKKNLKKLFHGAVCFKTTCDYIRPRRFLDEQIALFKDDSIPNYRFFRERMCCGASVTLEFVTGATRIAFDYKFFLKTNRKSTFEVYVDGFLMYLVHDTDLQEGCLEFCFKSGEKHIEIYIPNYSEVGIKNFIIDGEYKAVPKNKTKVLFIGDSITQGCGTERSGQTYVNVVKRALNYEIINQGIGGYVFDKDLIIPLSFKPKKIVVAFGTNNRRRSDDENSERITAFFEKLNEQYGKLSVLVILPPYAGDMDKEFLREKFAIINRMIVKTASKYSNVKITSAYKMIPHLPEYYSDMLHPNALGAEVYGTSIIKEIKKIKF